MLASAFSSVQFSSRWWLRAGERPYNLYYTVDYTVRVLWVPELPMHSDIGNNHYFFSIVHSGYVDYQYTVLWQSLTERKKIRWRSTHFSSCWHWHYFHDLYTQAWFHDFRYHVSWQARFNCLTFCLSANQNNQLNPQVLDNQKSRLCLCSLKFRLL